MSLMRQHLQADYSRWHGRLFAWDFKPFWHEPELTFMLYRIGLVDSA